MSVAIAASTDVIVPLELTVEQEGVGGVTGLTGGSAPLVRVRDATTINSYLDFDDNTFLTSGWTQQDQALTEVGGGHYTHALNLALILSLTVGNMLVAEYRVDDGGDIKGIDHDIIIIGISTLGDLGAIGANLELLRKSVTNRIEEFPGNPGTLILWDDDSITPLLTWELRDAAGNGIVATVGAPAKRTKAT